MKYVYSNAKVLVPWFDSTGKKQWFTMNFGGYVPRRAMRRCMRKLIQATFNITPSKTWLNSLISASLEPTLKVLNAQYTRKRATDEEVEAWIGRIQCDDDTPDTEGDASIQNQPAGEAGLEVSAMPDQSQV